MHRLGATQPRGHSCGPATSIIRPCLRENPQELAEKLAVATGCAESVCIDGSWTACGIRAGPLSGVCVARRHECAATIRSAVDCSPPLPGALGTGTRPPGCLSRFCTQHRRRGIHWGWPAEWQEKSSRTLMRTLIAVVIAPVAITALPATAQADRSDCPRKLERSYSKHYRMVAKRHGTRAPGRNIRKQGMLVTWGKNGRHKAAFDAMCSELRTSRRQLRKLLTPPRVRWPAQLATAAVPPPQRPSGVSSSGTVASGAGGSSNAYVNPACESGGNSQVVSPSGQYWGKYQFDYGTWVAHGGSGSSYGSASEAEQDRIAANVQYDAWPNC